MRYEQVLKNNKVVDNLITNNSRHFIFRIKSRYKYMMDFKALSKINIIPIDMKNVLITAK